MEFDMEHFIPVATFSTEIEAELAQATLAAAGIESFLKFDDTGGMMPWLQQIKGVKLLVDEKNAEEAATVLSTPSSDQL